MSEITLFCPIKAAPGKGAEMKTALLALAAETRKEAGNICYRLHTADDPDEFIIYEQWRDAAALDFHMQTPHLTAFLADEKGLLAGEPAGKFATEIK